MDSSQQHNEEGMHDNHNKVLLLATLLFLTTFVASALLLLFQFDCAVIAFWSLLCCIHSMFSQLLVLLLLLLFCPFCNKFLAVFFLLHTKVVDIFVASAFLVDPLLKCVKIKLCVITSCLMQLSRCHGLHSAILDILVEKHLCNRK